MLEAIRKAWRDAMSPKKPTAEQLDAQEGDARQQLQLANTDLADLELKVAQQVVSQPADEMSLKRADKALDDARDRVRRWERQLQRIQAMQEETYREAAARRLSETFDSARQSDRERQKVAAELGDWAKHGAALMRRYSNLCIEIIGTLPHRPTDIPASFTGGPILQRLLDIALYAEAAELWPARGVGLTRWEAMKQKTLAKRAADESQQLFGQYPQARNSPPMDAA